MSEMTPYLQVLFIFACSAIIICSVRSKAKTNPKQPAESKDEQPYIFPEISDGDAVEPGLRLLQSQKKYYDKIYDLYEKLWKKDEKNGNLRRLSYEFGDSIMLAGDMIHDRIDIIEEYMKNRTDDDALKKEPIDDDTASSLLDNWKFIEDYVNNAIEEYGLDADKETSAMRKPLELAIREMETYNKYLDTLYEEEDRTRIARP